MKRLPFGRFSLVKWYLDCVTDAGDAAMVYCATLHWRGMRARMGSVLTLRGRDAETRSSISSFTLARHEAEIVVTHPALGISGSWRADAQAKNRTVYETPAGSVVWNCIEPRSRVSVRIGDCELAGLGYAECLTVTLPPWRLPLRKLRWGRFVSERDALAWIDWEGEHTTRFAVLNGGECELGPAGEKEIALKGASLHMTESILLRGGRLADTILPGAPALGRLFPRSLFAVEERKWLSRGSFATPDHRSDGWVIHEVVNWGG